MQIYGAGDGYQASTHCDPIEIKHNINNCFPMIGAFRSNTSGHMVTFEGYRVESPAMYVYYWNAATGNTEMTVCTIFSMQFNMSGKTYSWVESILQPYY